MKEKQSQPGSFTALELTEAATLAPTEVLSHLASGLEGLSQTEVDCRVANSERTCSRSTA